MGKPFWCRLVAQGGGSAGEVSASDITAGCRSGDRWDVPWLQREGMVADVVAAVNSRVTGRLHLGDQPCYTNGNKPKAYRLTAGRSVATEIVL